MNFLTTKPRAGVRAESVPFAGSDFAGGGGVEGGTVPGRFQGSESAIVPARTVSGMAPQAADPFDVASVRVGSVPTLRGGAGGGIAPPNFALAPVPWIPIIPDMPPDQLCDGTPVPDGFCDADTLVPYTYNGGGELTLFNSQGSTGDWVRTGPDLRTVVDPGTPFRRVTIDLSGRPPDQYPIHQVGQPDDAPSLWIEGIWSDGKGAIYALYQDDNNQPCYDNPDPSLRRTQARYRAGMAKSVDGGVTFHDLGIIMRGVDGVAPRCDTQSTDTVGGNGDMTLYVDTQHSPGYVYVFFSGYEGTLAQGYQGVGVARLPLSDIDHPVGRFQKWYRGGWADAGAGPGGPYTPIFPALREMHPTAPRPPLPAPCVPTSDFVWGPHVYFDENAGQYVMILNRINDPTGVCTEQPWGPGGSWVIGGWDQADIRVSFSPDLSDPSRWASCTPDTPAGADACDADSRLNSRPFYVGNADDIGAPPYFYFYAQVIGFEPGDTSQDIADGDPKDPPRLYDTFFYHSNSFHVLAPGEDEPGGKGVIVRHTHVS